MSKNYEPRLPKYVSPEERLRQRQEKHEHPKSRAPIILMMLGGALLIGVLIGVGTLIGFAYGNYKFDKPAETPSAPVKPSKRIGPSDIPPEVCDNAIDDDYDGNIDCHDTDCARFVLCMAPKYKPGSPCFTSRLGPCKEGRWSVKHDSFYKQFCIPNHKGCIKKEVCGDMIDNDADGDIDCTDADCSTHIHCNLVELCNDGFDNNGDGLVDCADPACAAYVACQPQEDCVNGVDDDGFADCMDTDCSKVKACNPKLKRKASMKP
ncbi:hypothetical protein ACFLZH_03690 [Patescibacteria group bacterium]